MNSRTIIKLCLAALVALILIWMKGNWAKWEDEKVVYKLISIIALAVGGGIFFVMVLLPKFGDAVGTVMYSSGEEVTSDDAMKAAAKMAKGDYQGAIEEFEKLLKEKPEDPYPISEIAKIYSEKLDDPGQALTFLQGHLEAHEWPADTAAFIMFRMVDVHTQQHDLEAAKDILEQIVGNFPGTRHSANAKHKINELEQVQFKELQAQRAGRGGGDGAPPA